jgi:iron complex transport system substrate-binding protein
MPWPPQRIICLSEETAEALYLLGEEARIVGVTSYAERPARIRNEKPTVGAFTAADVPGILELEPDLVLTYSDLQAEVSNLLIRAGVAVHAFNHHDVEGIFDMTACLGGMVNASDRAQALIDGWRDRIEAMRATPPLRRPRVWFEEWDEPLIAGIGWVTELIEIAGGRDVVSHLRAARATRERIVTPAEIAATRPDLILASWCGKRVHTERIAARPGWHLLPAVRRNMVMEVRAPLLLAPGPGALTDGLDALRSAVLEAAEMAATEEKHKARATG